MYHAVGIFIPFVYDSSTVDYGVLTIISFARLSLGHDHLATHLEHPLEISSVLLCCLGYDTSVFRGLYVYLVF